MTSLKAFPKEIFPSDVLSVNLLNPPCKALPVRAILNPVRTTSVVMELALMDAALPELSAFPIVFICFRSPYTMNILAIIPKSLFISELPSPSSLSIY